MKSLASLPATARAWTARSLRAMDVLWQEDAGLILAETGRPEVRGTAWYALGLLLRNGAGDVARACQAIRAVIRYQWTDLTRVYGGSFARHPGEFVQPEDPVAWKDYDPNWREFIGTALALIVEEFAALLPAEPVQAILHSIRLAAAGAYERDVTPHYTNIALMSAFLLDYAGAHFDLPAYRGRAARLAEQIYALFSRHQTFEEYNSPTYYGVDLYALALWRLHGLTPDMREMGRAMEAALWRDIGQFYHAGMRNLCGPWSRSYGMDMTRYVAWVGVWIAMAVDEARAPLPDLARPFEHAVDLNAIPLVAVLGAEIPPDVLPHLHSFVGERRVERVIADEPRWVATAWLSPQVMLGGALTAGRLPSIGQSHLATLHWLQADGAVGWIRVRCPTPVDAEAAPNTLTITGHPAADGEQPLEMTFEIGGFGANQTTIEPDRWSLPGLTVRVETAAGAPTVLSHEKLQVRYTTPSGPLTVVLSTQAPAEEDTSTGKLPV